MICGTSSSGLTEEDDSLPVELFGQIDSFAAMERAKLPKELFGIDFFFGGGVRKLAGKP